MYVRATLFVSLSLLAVSACSGGNKAAKFESSRTKYGTPLAVQNLKLYAGSAPDQRLGLVNYENCVALEADVNGVLEKANLEAKAFAARSIVDELNWRAEYDRNEGVRADSSAGGSADAPAEDVSSEPESAADGASSKDESLTNVQERGVDEADQYKVGPTQIFVVKGSEIQVLERSTLQKLGKISLGEQAQSYGSSTQLFTKGNQLIVIEQVYEKNTVKSDGGYAEPMPDFAADVEFGYGWGYQQKGSKVSLYSTAAGQMPKLVKAVEFEGQYLDSRLVQNRLLLVMNDSLATENTPFEWSEFSGEAFYGNPKAKEIFESWIGQSYQKRRLKAISGDQIAGVNCAQITRSKVMDWDTSLVKAFTLDISKPEVPAQAAASIGAGHEVYMTADALYLLKSKVEWFSREWAIEGDDVIDSGVDVAVGEAEVPNEAVASDSIWYGPMDEKLHIRQLSFSAASGEVKAIAEGEVKGRIKDRWALSGKNAGANLIVATSTGFLGSNDDKTRAQNHLFVLSLNAANKSLDLTAGIGDYGTNEDIRSVRYIGDKAFVVTFRQTDPLFAFDLSNLAEPKLLSGLKVPGFSKYMHPLADGRLLGVGFDAYVQGEWAIPNGVQVSVFDTSDPTNMSRLDNHVFGKQGSHSEVVSDHHAFFYDQTSGLIGLPMELTSAKYGQIAFSGAIMMQYANNKLTEVGRLGHNDLITSACSLPEYYGSSPAAIRRIFNVDGKLVTLSQAGLKAYDMNDLTSVLASVAFEVKACN